MEKIFKWLLELNTRSNKLKYYKLKKYDYIQIWNIHKLKHYLNYLPLLDASLHAQSNVPQINVFTEATLWEKKKEVLTTQKCNKNFTMWPIVFTEIN